METCRNFPHFLVVACMLAGGVGCLAPSGQERLTRYNDDGVRLFNQGDYPHALDSFDAALTLQPNDPALLYNIGQCYDRMGQPDRAERYYQACLQRSPAHRDARHALVAGMYRHGRREPADQLIQDWLRSEPQSSDAYALEGWRLHRAGDLPGAQGRLQQALSLDGKNTRALVELGLVFEDLGLPDRALAMYERVLEREPYHAEVAARLAALRAQGVRWPTPG
jgi:tetratricopeptide (TPR) repeat protein